MECIYEEILQNPQYIVKLNPGINMLIYHDVVFNLVFTTSTSFLNVDRVTIELQLM